MKPKTFVNHFLAAWFLLAAWPVGAEADVRLISGLPFNSGDAANGASQVADQTADGRFVLFLTRANNLDPAIFDINNRDDVYVLDRQSGAFDLITRPFGTTNQTPIAFQTRAVALSDDGRWVLFDSNARTLVPGITYTDLGNFNAVYLFDRTDRTTQLVSHLPGNPTTTMARASADDLSADGRFVLFSDDDPDHSYLFDRTTGEVTLAHHAAGLPGQAAAGRAFEIGLSADGNLALIDSNAAELVSGQLDNPGASRDVFVYHRPSQTYELVSRSAANPLQAVGGEAKAASSDGRFLLYDHKDMAVVSGFSDGNGSTNPDVFLFDRQTGTQRLISVSATLAGTSANAGSRGFAVSDDGRYVYFTSTATDLVAGFVDGNGASSDAYLFDVSTSTTTLVSHVVGNLSQSGSKQASFADLTASMSSDGRYVLFSSSAIDLQTGVTDTNNLNDLYLYDRLANTSTLVSRIGGSLTAGGGWPPGPVADDGAAIFVSASPLDPLVGDPFGERDLFRFDPAAPTVELLTAAGTRGRTPVPPGFYVYNYVASLSATGRWATWDDFVFDPATLTLELFHHPAGNTSLPATGKITSTVISPDGRFVTYSSEATGLQAGVTDTNQVWDVFLYDRQADAATLISHIPGAPTVAANGSSVIQWQSDDAQLFAVASRSSNLVTGMAPNPTLAQNVYLYDRPSQTTELISHGVASLVQSGGFDSDFLAISADRRYVFYQSAGFNQVANFVDHNDYLYDDGDLQYWVRLPDLYLRDRQTHTAQLISGRPGQPEGSAGTPENPRITMDFSAVYFHSTGDDLVANQVPAPGNSKVFRWNRVTGNNELVVPAAGNPAQPCDGSMFLGDISANGRWVLVSGTCALVPTDTNGLSDTYLLDRETQTFTLISHQNGSPSLPLAVDTHAKHVSDDGRVVLYSRLTTDGPLYAYDRGTQKATLMTAAWNDPQREVNAHLLAASTDSLQFLVSSADSQMVPFDSNGGPDFFHVTIGALFADGFEAGNTAVWSLTVP